jgi:hypothetical protein
MRRPNRANSPEAPICATMNPAIASTATNSPTAIGIASFESGSRATRMHRPITANTTWARTSAVASTTVEAAAVSHAMPCRVAARAPRRKPPTCASGRQLDAASRTILAHTSTSSVRRPPAARIVQALPSTTNSTPCQASTTANPRQPTASTRPNTSRTPATSSSRPAISRPITASRMDARFTQAGPADGLGRRPLHQQPVAGLYVRPLLDTQAWQAR